jgi:hypothetical protein
MQLFSFLRFNNLYFLLVCISSAQALYQRPPHQTRDIFSAIGSLADSVLGISTAQSTEQTAVAASATPQMPTTQIDSTSAAIPQVVTVVPTAAATSSSSQTGATGTGSDASSISTAQSATSSPTSTTTDQSSSQTISPLSSQTSPTPATPANPIQGLSSSSASSTEIKQDNGNRVSAAGVAVAVVFGALILAGIAYLLYRHFRSARDKTATAKPSEYDEMKRFSYLDDDAERGTAYNPGLGLGTVSKLRNATTSTTPDDAEPYRTRSRAGSEDSLVRESTLPVSPLDRREPPLPPLPNHAQEPWPIVSAFGMTHQQSLLVKIPATATSLGRAGGGYVPYRREAAPVIGLAVPLSSGHVQNSRNLDHHDAPPSEQTRQVATFGKARRVSGVHELS